MAGMDEGKGKGKGDRHEMRRGELKAENGEIKKDGHGAAGSQVVTQSGITWKGGG